MSSSNPKPNSNLKPNSDPNLKPNLKPNSNPKPNQKPNPNPNPNLKPNQNPNPNPNPNPNLKPNPNPNPNLKPNQNPNPNPNPNLKPNSDPNLKPNSDPNSDLNLSDLNLNVFFKKIPTELNSLFKNQEKPWSLLLGDLKKFFPSENKIEGVVSPQAYLEGKGIVVESGARIEAFSYIKGPCFVGSGSEIRHGAYLRGHVYIGRNCVVGHSTEIKHSILFDGAKAGHFNYVGDSILGNGVNLGAGTKIANLKITPGSIVLKVNGKFIDTELRKFGAVIGDHTQTGCNSVLNPGTLLASFSKVFPLALVSGVHLKKKLIKK